MVSLCSDSIARPLLDLKRAAVETITAIELDAADLIADLTGHQLSQTEFAPPAELRIKAQHDMLALGKEAGRGTDEAVDYATVDLSRFTLPQAIDQAVAIETTTPKIGGERRDGPLTLLPLGHFGDPLAAPPSLWPDELPPLPRIPKDERF